MPALRRMAKPIPMTEHERDPELAQWSDEELQTALEYYVKHHNKHAVSVFWGQLVSQKASESHHRHVNAMLNAKQWVEAIQAEQEYRRIP